MKSNNKAVIILVLVIFSTICSILSRKHKKLRRRKADDGLTKSDVKKCFGDIMKIAQPNIKKNSFFQCIEDSKASLLAQFEMVKEKDKSSCNKLYQSGGFGYIWNIVESALELYGKSDASSRDYYKTQMLTLNKLCSDKENSVFMGQLKDEINKY